jgi:hypothetical protein
MSGSGDIHSHGSGEGNKKKGEQMKVEITAPIEDIKGSTGITDMGDADYSLKMKVQITPGDYARLMSLQRQRVSLKLTISAEQAMFDLVVAQVGLKAEQKPEVKAGDKPVEALKDAKQTIPFVESAGGDVTMAPVKDKPKEKVSSGKAS